MVLRLHRAHARGLLAVTRRDAALVVPRRGLHCIPRPFRRAGWNGADRRVDADHLRRRLNPPKMGLSRGDDSVRADPLLLQIRPLLHWRRDRAVEQWPRRPTLRRG